MQDRQGWNQQQGSGQIQSGVPTPQEWQFAKADRNGQSPAATDASPQNFNSDFQFVRPPAPQDALKESFDSGSEEFSCIIDQKLARRRRNGRISLLVTITLLLSLTGGGTGWFISDPNRVTALKTAISDIKGATDVGAMKAKYDQALAKIGSRKTEIDDATKMMGIDPTQQASHEDEYFSKEMREMMGEGEGPTVGERNRNFAATADQLLKAGLLKDVSTSGGHSR
jgi:hypothetical protein